MFFIVKPFENKFHRFTQYVSPSNNLKVNILSIVYNLSITYLSVQHASISHCISERIFVKQKEIEEIERTYCLEEFDFDYEIEIASVICEV